MIMIYGVIIPFVLHMITYWTSSIIFLIMDTIYLDSNHINWKKYPRAIKISLANQFFITLPTVTILSPQLTNSINLAINDSWILTLIKIFLIINLSNILFYSFHWLLHRSWFYKNIHYRHHEFVEPVAAATLYAHPIEHLFSNVLSFFIPIILIGTTYKITIGLLVISTLISTFAHVNYIELPIENEHGYHHKKFRYNFGFGGYLDKLLGTSMNSNS